MKSILTNNQKKTLTKTLPNGDKMTVTIRYDDECKNGHNSFAITGDIREPGARDSYVAGCIHDEIRLHFPELALLIKFHLMSSDGPMHYVANSIYHASNRDCSGLLKDERRQIKNGRTGLPAWHLVAIDKDGNEVELYNLEKSKDSLEKPECNYTLEFRPWCRVGEGKEPDLEAARSSAIWPDAELKDFTKENLEARLPALIEEFRKAVESLGFIF